MVYINLNILDNLTFLVITLVISTIGLVVGLLLLFGQSVSSFSSKILSGLILSLVITALGNIIPLTQFYINYPEYYRIHAWAPFCMGPFAYLYVKSILHQSYRFQKRDAFLIIPLVIYVLNRIPFYLLSYEKKLNFVKQTLIDNRLYVLEPDGWFPAGWMAIFRISTLLFFLISAIFLLLSWRKKILNAKIIIKRNIQIYLFLWVIILFLLIGTLVVYSFIISQIRSGNTSSQSGILVGEVTIATLLIEILLISVYLLAQPKILYGMIGWIQIIEPVLSLNDSSDSEDFENMDYISVYQGRNILSSINKHFQKKHPYLKVGYTITDLSNEVKIPVYLISPLINQEFGKNFNEFINDARISYLKTFKMKDPNFEKYSIEHIGNMIGFSSRTSFIAAVKKRTGMVPKEYLASI
ncbi:helix-turn-helix domain-containing protein [Aquirufa rosea]|uniref:Helix-turn-helix domain-containing protein n=1 Tax=Aquirufa rosea TaxID=2509241 RepID=A0A4Q1C005_9BACT|nr:helix-turn-helix domain-containing protein [Aquirufa rosea]RXK49746.1 helix-turn-helix domain-containing protein [Aquirufa rosea]